MNSKPQTLRAVNDVDIQTLDVDVRATVAIPAKMLPIILKTNLMLVPQWPYTVLVAGENFPPPCDWTVQHIVVEVQAGHVQGLPAVDAAPCRLSIPVRDLATSHNTVWHVPVGHSPKTCHDNLGQLNSHIARHRCVSRSILT